MNYTPDINPIFFISKSEDLSLFARNLFVGYMHSKLGDTSHFPYVSNKSPFTTSGDPYFYNYQKATKDLLQGDLDIDFESEFKITASGGVLIPRKPTLENSIRQKSVCSLSRRTPLVPFFVFVQRGDFREKIRDDLREYGWNDTNSISVSLEEVSSLTFSQIPRSHKPRLTRRQLIFGSVSEKLRSRYKNDAFRTQTEILYKGVKDLVDNLTSDEFDLNSLIK